MIDTISVVTCSCGHMSVSADTKTSKTLHREHAAGRLGHFYGPPTPLSNPCSNFSQVRHLARQEAEERRALMYIESTCGLPVPPSKRFPFDAAKLGEHQNWHPPTQPREQLGNAEHNLLRGLFNVFKIYAGLGAIIALGWFAWGKL